MNQGDVSHRACEIDGRFDGGIASPHHNDILSGKQRAIADSTVSDTLMPEFFLAGNTQLTGTGTCGDQDCAAFEVAVVIQIQDKVFPFPSDGGDCPPSEQGHIIGLEMALKFRSQFRTGNTLNTKVVLDYIGLLDLATDGAADNCCSQALSSGIDSGIDSGRAGSDHQQIVQNLRIRLIVSQLQNTKIQTERQPG